MLLSAPVVNSTKHTEVNSFKSITPFEAQKSFSSFLKESIEKVNEAQIESDQLTEKLSIEDKMLIYIK